MPSPPPPLPPAPPEASAEPGPAPWQRIAVGVPGMEFEARPPSQYAFDFPDSECEGWSTDALTLRFASVRGAKHRYYRQPRQDAARAAVHEATDSIVFAVADGVSSASESHQGAVEACRAAVERILHLLDRTPGPLDPADVAAHAAERLRQLAQWRLGVIEPGPVDVARLYATTLVAGAVRPTAEGLRIELFRIGDSGAWILDRAHGGYRPLFGSKTASDALLVSNEVSPLPRVPDRLETATGLLVAPWTLLVGTDGFGDPLGEGDGLVGSHFARHLGTPPPPLWFGHVLDFTRETFDDDRTLLALWPRNEAEPR
ncbi:protein phosphatase 2C domain-containing protein [Kitasatospora sp. NPDC059571]|uniref:protein phosphatase 2C domain-containing protein n=1 Tax=Kitasatospora sp. NPDC059571 TaxID=3346871 RepID=UPI0036B8047E